MWDVGHTTGLRERKKARTRAAIQDAALRLFNQQGYHATTTEQIAEAAEVSPSTFFRYFPTKAETVLYDRLDPVLLAAMMRQPAELSPAAAIRTAIHEVMGQLDDDEAELELTRWQLVAGVPELRAAAFARTAPMAALMAEAVAQRTGRRADDLEVRTWVGAFIGVVYAAFFAAVSGDDPDFLSLFDRAMAHFEAGLPL
jgi:AcrR family transcriptional regulator